MSRMSNLQGGIKGNAPNKKILIAIPTNTHIENATFKALYDQHIPTGYDTTFQWFYGYSVQQVRNFIASYANQYDYIWFVDADIVPPTDCLAKMLSFESTDIISGIYRQRKDDVLELYRKDSYGRLYRLTYAELNTAHPLMEVGGCGFGCVLVPSQILLEVGYPQFEYSMTSATEIEESEDCNFCRKATKRGYKIYVDTTIRCQHIGSQALTPSISPFVKVLDVEAELRALSKRDLLPQTHTKYLWEMRREQNVRPKVIYDIGASVLHWTRAAHMIWPDAEIIAFDAATECNFLYHELEMRFNSSVLSAVSGENITFWKNATNPGGNSRYKENSTLSPNADKLYTPENRLTETLDDVVARLNFPLPDMIKMDVQGAELSVLKGAKNTLATCTDLIVELQLVNYNLGAPKAPEVIAYLLSEGWILKTPLFSQNGEIDGDYHFIRTIN